MPHTAQINHPKTPRNSPKIPLFFKLNKEERADYYHHYQLYEQGNKVPELEIQHKSYENWQISGRISRTSMQHTRVQRTHATVKDLIGRFYDLDKGMLETNTKAITEEYSDHPLFNWNLPEPSQGKYAVLQLLKLFLEKEEPILKRQLLGKVKQKMDVIRELLGEKSDRYVRRSNRLKIEEGVNSPARFRVMVNQIAMKARAFHLCFKDPSLLIKLDKNTKQPIHPWKENKNKSYLAQLLRQGWRVGAKLGRVTVVDFDYLKKDSNGEYVFPEWVRQKAQIKLDLIIFREKIKSYFETKSGFHLYFETLWPFKSGKMYIKDYPKPIGDVLAQGKYVELPFNNPDKKIKYTQWEYRGGQTPAFFNYIKGEKHLNFILWKTGTFRKPSSSIEKEEGMIEENYNNQTNSTSEANFSQEGVNNYKEARKYKGNNYGEKIRMDSAKITYHEIIGDFLNIQVRWGKDKVAQISKRIWSYPDKIVKALKKIGTKLNIVAVWLRNRLFYKSHTLVN